MGGEVVGDCVGRSVCLAVVGARDLTGAEECVGWMVGLALRVTAEGLLVLSLSLVSRVGLGLDLFVGFKVGSLVCTMTGLSSTDKGVGLCVLINEPVGLIVLSTEAVGC